jgi:hypothetical protein
LVARIRRTPTHIVDQLSADVETEVADNLAGIDQQLTAARLSFLICLFLPVWPEWILPVSSLFREGSLRKWEGANEQSPFRVAF